MKTLDPVQAGDQVLAHLTNVCGPNVKGAHDSGLLILDGKAYIVYMANDVQPGEAQEWPFVYSALTVLDVASRRIELTVTFAASEMQYENHKLPVGACFVPRIIQLDARTLRCFFTSEQPGVRPSQFWYIDFDLATRQFRWAIHPVELEIDGDVFPMQPPVFHQHAQALGFPRPSVLQGLYLIDGFKHFDGRVYAVLGNFINGQHALVMLNEPMNRFVLQGDLSWLPHEAKLTECAVNRLPDGRWMAVSRQDNRDQNYMVSTSADGRCWTEHRYVDFIQHGTNSKPTLDCFGDTYYLGWNEATQIDGALRSVFNLDASKDGVTWQRRYRFQTARSFQYPVFREYAGNIYFTVTQGDASSDRKERIMFGKLGSLS